MLTNPKDKFERILKIVDNELREQYQNNFTLDSTPILEMVRDELTELELELNDDWSLTSLLRRFQLWNTMRQTANIVRTSKHSDVRSALSLVTIALREEQNRYDSRSFSYWLSPLWQKLNVSRGLLVKSLEKESMKDNADTDSTGTRAST